MCSNPGLTSVQTLKNYITGSRAGGIKSCKWGSLVCRLLRDDFVESKSGICWKYYSNHWMSLCQSHRGHPIKLPENSYTIIVSLWIISDWANLIEEINQEYHIATQLSNLNRRSITSVENFIVNNFLKQSLIMGHRFHDFTVIFPGISRRFYNPHFSEVLKVLLFPTKNIWFIIYKTPLRWNSKP